MAHRVEHIMLGLLLLGYCLAVVLIFVLQNGYADPLQAQGVETSSTST